MTLFKYPLCLLRPFFAWCYEPFKISSSIFCECLRFNDKHGTCTKTVEVSTWINGGYLLLFREIECFPFFVYQTFIDIGSLILKYVGQSSDDINLSIHVPPLHKQNKF